MGFLCGTNKRYLQTQAWRWLATTLLTRHGLRSLFSLPWDQLVGKLLEWGKQKDRQTRQGHITALNGSVSCVKWPTCNIEVEILLQRTELYYLAGGKVKVQSPFPLPSPPLGSPFFFFFNAVPLRFLFSHSSCLNRVCCVRKKRRILSIIQV